MKIETRVEIIFKDTSDTLESAVNEWIERNEGEGFTVTNVQIFKNNGLSAAITYTRQVVEKSRYEED